MSRAESLRLLAQLSSLATLEAAVAHVQALLEAPPEPRGLPLTSRTSVAARAPALPCPISAGLPVKCSPVALLGFFLPRLLLLGLCHWPSRVTSTAGVARSRAPREPRAAATDPTASAARKASQRRRASGAAVARQRRRDKHRRRVRRATRRSMWREM